MKLSDSVLPVFHDFWREAKKGTCTDLVLKGGRDSGKSVVITQRIIMDIVELPVNVLCARRYANTLRDSQYEQIKKAIKLLGLNRYFKYGISPLKVTYMPRGNEIIFRGSDSPENIKSIVNSEFPIARMWMEELGDFENQEAVETIENSILRDKLLDGLRYKFYKSYNPPKLKAHWVNKKYNSAFTPANTYIHHSTYLDNPFVAVQVHERAEELKAKNNYKYKWIYMGEAIGGGIIPFDNLVFRPISSEEISQFDNIREGIDWGYAADPFAWVKWHYDKTRRTIYCMDEIEEVKLSNREAMDKLKGRHEVTAISDSAEPKSIAEFNRGGFRNIGAKKGKGSVEYGEKWLDDLEAIVIDPKLTPLTAKEFEDIDYDIDRYGNIKNRLIDKDNHTIDATRYAFERDMRNARDSVVTGA